ncbi:MAG: hypothetical protein LBD06_11605 [Candidatus Accumulibacter sp.]|jgi:hypothetical protein|nr:hypothetical protein [Accumulibacter sp.]
MRNRLFSRTGVRYGVAPGIVGAILARHPEVIAIERGKPVPGNPVIESAQEK